jgi:hypothetical protein
MFVLERYVEKDASGGIVAVSEDPMVLKERAGELKHPRSSRLRREMLKEWHQEEGVGLVLVYKGEEWMIFEVEVLRRR